jgi:uncharacterized caspase-like protein
VLDACRNNALKRSAARSGETRGLGTIANVSGMLFAYSTAAGEIAQNRPGQLSLYTELLVQELGKPGEPLISSFQRVRKQMVQALRRSGGEHVQMPEMTDDIVLMP